MLIIIFFVIVVIFSIFQIITYAMNKILIDECIKALYFQKVEIEKLECKINILEMKIKKYKGRNLT